MKGRFFGIGGEVLLNEIFYFFVIRVFAIFLD